MNIHIKYICIFTTVDRHTLLADDLQAIVHCNALKELKVASPQRLLINGGLGIGFFRWLLQDGIYGPHNGHEHCLQEPDDGFLMVVEQREREH